MFLENYSGYMKYEQDNSVIYRPNGTSDYLFLYFPLPMIFVIDDKEVATENNACILFKPGEFHHFYAKTKFCNSFLHFHADTDPTKIYSIKSGEIFYPSNADQLNKLIKKIHNEVLFKNTHSDEMINSYITQLLILSERSFAERDFSDIKALFYKIRSNMLANYSENHTAETLAAQAFMSRSRFYDYYKQFFGVSPKQELLNMRMEIAQALLTNKSKTTVEIAKEVGFDNVEHFTRYYKKYFGISPRRN